jgi:peroxiredoxin
MKHLTLIILFFTMHPLSIFAQMEMKFSSVWDSMGMVSFYYPDGDMGFEIVGPKDSMTLDSIKKNLCPYAILEKEKKRKTHREITLKAFLNSPVLDFEAPDTMGIVHHPANYRGRVLLLHFWNFWGFSFEREIPFLNNLIENHRKDGLEILSFVDIKIGDSERKKLKKEFVDFTLIPNAWQFSDKFLNIQKSKPYIVLIDKKGNIRHFFSHYEWQWERDKRFKIAGELAEKVESLLKE